jgi:hypothetical protein
LNLGRNGIVEVVDPDEVAYLLLRGEVDAGLLHHADVEANPGLQVIAQVPEDAAPPTINPIP